MIDKIKNLKFTEVLFLLLLAGFLFFLTTTKGEGPRNYEDLIAENETWLRQISEEITNVMDDENSYTSFVYRTTLLVSYYTSPSFSIEKLNELRAYLENSEWQQLPTQNYIGYCSESLGMSGQPATDRTIILCKKGATILIWMEDLKGKYEHTSDISTSIRITYDFRSPCFNLSIADNK